MFFTKAKEWKCNNQCGSNCCSEVFLKLDFKQQMSLFSNFSFITNGCGIDFIWLSYHTGIKIIILKTGEKLIEVDKEIPMRIIWNKYENSHFVRLETPCEKLLQDNKCSVYEQRPKACKISECPVFTIKPKIKWYADNSHLKWLRCKK